MKKYVKGNFTIEATVLVPLFLSVIVTAVTVLFYYHDRTLLAGVAYEVATCAAGRQEQSEEELEKEYRKRIGKKLLWLTDVTVKITKKKDAVSVVAKASHKGFRTSVIFASPVTHPEQWLRRRDYQ